MEDEALRALLSRSLAQQDIIEFLLFAYLDEKPPEAREIIMNFLVQSARQTVGEKPLSDGAAEMWADICVKRVQAVEKSAQRVRELLARAGSERSSTTTPDP